MLIASMQFILPTAINLMALSNLHKNMEIGLSKNLFVQYLASLVTMTFFIAIVFHQITESGGLGLGGAPSNDPEQLWFHDYQVINVN